MLEGTGVMTYSDYRFVFLCKCVLHTFLKVSKRFFTYCIRSNSRKTSEYRMRKDVKRSGRIPNNLEGLRETTKILRILGVLVGIQSRHLWTRSQLPTFFFP